MKRKTFALLIMCVTTGNGQSSLKIRASFPNANGVQETVTTTDSFDLQNPFFQALGTNGRSCVTCHQPSDGWSVSAEHIRSRFDATGGADPLFRPNDGSNCPDSDVSSPDRKRAAYGLLLSRGLIRVGIGVPAGGEFFLRKVTGGPGCTPSNGELSLYRRPLPSTNLRFLTSVMWDGREPSLEHQVIDATNGHAQAAQPPTNVQVAAIVAFELGLHTAQQEGKGVGSLTASGSHGGAGFLAEQLFHIGVNDALSPGFNPNVFNIFDGWASKQNGEPHRQSVARGQQIFNTRQFQITGVKGLNDVLGASAIPGTCTVCHDSPNVGNHSVKLAIDIGLTNPAQAPYLPVYTLQNFLTGETIDTTDPGKAMISGKWADVNKFKGAILRGLSARAPYFHNGSAATLEEAVRFYDTRFSIGLSATDRSDLGAFLAAL